MGDEMGMGDVFESTTAGGGGKLAHSDDGTTRHHGFDDVTLLEHGRLLLGLDVKDFQDPENGENIRLRREKRSDSSQIYRPTLYRPTVRLS